MKNKFRLKLLTVVVLAQVSILTIIARGEGSPLSTPEGRQDRPRYAGECTTDGIKYRRQYTATQLRQIFGNPANPELTGQLVVSKVLDQPVRVHRKVAACLEAVERARVARGIVYAVDKTDPLGGIGGYRRNDGQLGESSYHVYGAAIDINPSQNPHCRSGAAVDPEGRCDSKQPYTIPDELVGIFKDYGFTWGGNWRRNKDYMHFEWHGESPMS